MMTILSDEDLARSTFTIADLINADPKKTFKGCKDGLKAVKINLQAAKAAMAAASFSQAVEYLEAGFARLPSNIWQQDR